MFQKRVPKLRAPGPRNFVAALDQAFASSFAMASPERRSPAIGLVLDNAVGMLVLADLPTPVLHLILSYTGSGVNNLDGIRVTKDEILQEHTLLCWHLWARLPL